MKATRSATLAGVGFFAAVGFLAETASAQVNSWSNSANGTHKWEDSTKWSLGIPPSSSLSAVFITNGVGVSPRNRTVMIDATTAGSFPGTMTVSNLTVAVTSPGIGNNTLFLNNAGLATPLHIISRLVISNSGSVLITNSVLLVGRPPPFPLGNGVFIDGTLQLNTGTLNTTNTLEVFVGFRGFGQMTVLDGTWQASSVVVGNFPGSRGTLTFAGGTTTLPLSSIFIGDQKGATGVVSMTGGQLIAAAQVGYFGVGQMTVTGGTWLAGHVGVAELSDPLLGSPQGTLTLAGGSTVITGVGENYPGFAVALTENTTGTVWLTGGQLITTNTSTVLGNGCCIDGDRLGQMIVSNGTWSAHDVSVGIGYSGHGKLRMVGGTVTLSSNLVVGNCKVYGSEGEVSVYRSALYVTNASHTAVLDVQSGTVTVQASGMLVADVVVVTNSCGVLFSAGGMLMYGNTILDPDEDADVDGLPNAWEQMHGLDPFDPFFDNGPYGDPDGDGVSNIDEYELDTDPTDPHDPIRITSITRETNNIRITWQYVPPPFGVLSNCMVEASPTVTGAWNNVSGTIKLPSDFLIVASTNFVQTGGATNFPSRFYRVHLMP